MSDKNITILQRFNSSKAQVAVLIDPEKCDPIESPDGFKSLTHLIKKAEFAGVHYFFIGGSTVTRESFNRVVDYLKKSTVIPLVIFPGASHQISEKADALLYLSLISGRNPDFLIGHHVMSANEVFAMDIEKIPTGYILVEGGTNSSVAYVSQTTPIPSDKGGIILSTAKAGILQGKQLIYLDAGSGARHHVPAHVIESVSELGLPVIVGGGIKSRDQIEDLHKAGANVVVIGNKLEEEIDFLLDIQSYISDSKKK